MGTTDPFTISHIRPSDWAKQDNEEHQAGVARRAARFAEAFGMAAWGQTAGALHDKGKEQASFQQHIQKASGYAPDLHVEGNHEHAYVGALLAKQFHPQAHPLLDNIIAGHHRGLYDDAELRGVLQKNLPAGISIPSAQTPLTLPSKPYQRKDIHHIGRMLFSCLTDADYLDTEAFMKPEQSALRGAHSPMEELAQRLALHMERLEAQATQSDVNAVRHEVQQACVKESQGAAGFYSLTVPTGGGKTLASMTWALRHAVKNGLERIIIAIPYTSIIVQTAATLKAIFGTENVLEHHSVYEADNIRDPYLRQRHLLATENWDYPIIVTTNVQLFESLFSNRPSVCRKLHNIARSVVVLDEVQTLPTDFLKPIIDTTDTLHRIFGTSFLFTTASQPILTGRIRGTNQLQAFEGLSDVHEIIPETARLHERLRRVRLHFDTEASNYDELAQRLSGHEQVVCVVNTRKDAQELFARLKEQGDTVHLSRMMCPRHVGQTIETIKTRMKSAPEGRLRVVSTQLIEAGVDLDFPVVYRQEAGLDSILQAAGRCNREGKRALCPTYVFSLSKEHRLPPGHIARANDARRGMAITEDCDWFAPETMRAYFAQFYARCDTFDRKGIGEELYHPAMNFETAAQAFRLIGENGHTLVVNWGESPMLIKQLKQEGPNYRLMKRLGGYSVNVGEQVYRLLQEAGAVEEVVEGIFYIPDTRFYDPSVGLITENHWIEEIQII